MFQASPGFITAPQTISVGGSDLEGPITITPPNGFQISTSEDSGFTDGSITLAATSGGVPATTVYVRFAPTALGEFIGSILLTSPNADTKLVAVTGTVDSVPIIKVTPPSLTGFRTPEGAASESQAVSVTGLNIQGEGISATASGDFEISRDNINFSTSLTMPKQGTGTVGEALYVRISGSATAIPLLTGTVTLSNGPTIVTIALSGQVCLRPFVGADPNLIYVDSRFGTSFCSSQSFQMNGPICKAPSISRPRQVLRSRPMLFHGPMNSFSNRRAGRRRPRGPVQWCLATSPKPAEPPMPSVPGRPISAGPCPMMRPRPRAMMPVFCRVVRRGYLRQGRGRTRLHIHLFGFGDGQQPHHARFPHGA